MPPSQGVSSGPKITACHTMIYGGRGFGLVWWVDREVRPLPPPWVHHPASPNPTQAEQASPQVAARTLLSSGAPCTPWGGSLWSRFRSRISRRRAAVDMVACWSLTAACLGVRALAASES